MDGIRTTQGGEIEPPHSGELNRFYFPIDQAEIETVDSLSKRITNLETNFADQRNNNRNIIYAVLIAAFLILVTVAIEIIIFHTRANDDVLNLQTQFFQETTKIREKFSEIQLDFQTIIQNQTSNENSAKQDSSP